MVVGLGQIGMGYDLDLNAQDCVYTHARAFSSHPDFRLACGVDPSPEARGVFLERYGCPAYSTVEEALSLHEVDVIAIGTPTEDHASTLRKALEMAKPVAILCEKPLASSVQEAHAMVDMCAAANAALYVNYIRRSAPGVAKVKAMIDAGQIALPVRGIVWYSKGFIHNGSHFFDLASYWLGDFQSAQIIERGRDYEQNDGEPAVRVSYAGGEIVFMPAWEEHFSHCTFELVSPSGRLYWGQGTLGWQAASQDPILPTYTILPKAADSIQTGMERYQWHVVDQISNAISGKAFSICTGQQAFEILSAMHKILSISRNIQPPSETAV